MNRLDHLEAKSSIMSEAQELSTNPSVLRKIQDEPNDDKVADTRVITELPHVTESSRSVTGIKVRWCHNIVTWLTIDNTQWILVVVGILSSILVYALDTTITADVIPVKAISGLRAIYATDTLNHRA